MWLLSITSIRLEFPTEYFYHCWTGTRLIYARTSNSREHLCIFVELIEPMNRYIVLDLMCRRCMQTVSRPTTNFMNTELRIDAAAAAAAADITHNNRNTWWKCKVVGTEHCNNNNGGMTKQPREPSWAFHQRDKKNCKNNFKTEKTREEEEKQNVKNQTKI